MKKTILTFLLSSIAYIVYPQGFAGTSSNWSTPVGGYYGSSAPLGYYQLYHSLGSGVNCETWSLVDMNGDDKPDLVISSEYQTSISSYQQFGAGTNPYWKVYLNTGLGMSATPVNWSTPIGGYYSAGTPLGYHELNHSLGSGANSETWSLVDMNGDNKPDLVISSQYQTGISSYQQFGAGTNPYWKVYLNTGTGMSATPVNWSTPIGGYYSSGTPLGYHELNHSLGSGVNCETWSLADMNGDNKPDLVISSQYQTGISHYQQFGAGTNPYWKVYLNTGTGMSATPVNWSTPIGGYYSGANQLGYYELYHTNGSGTNTESWSLTDMDGDNKPDLVISSVYQTGTSSFQQFGAGTNPYWKVHLNTGSGMSAAPVNWSTPIGGYYSGANQLGYYELYHTSGSGTNTESWWLTDMDGDNKPDLVISSVYQTGISSFQQFGAGTNPYWKVYLNTGSGMSATHVNWSTPIGGYYGSTTNLGYYQLYHTTGSGANSESWSLTDMDGDSKLDLVVTSVYQTGISSFQQFGAGTNPYWKVYLNLSSVGIESLQNNSSDCFLYPNPITDYLIFKVDDVLIGDIYSIVDLTGRIILTGLITNDVNKIELVNLVKGTYFIQTGAKQNMTIKFVKQ